MATTGSTVDVEQFLKNLTALRYREVTMTLATLAVLAGAVVFFPGMENVTQGIQADVSPGLLVLFLVVAIAAGAIKGMLGFGYALIATPVFASVVDPTLAVVVLAIPPWMINVFQVGETDTGLEFVREEWVLMVLAVLGAVVGVVALSTYSAGPIVPFVIALVILGYALFEIFGGFLRVEEAHHPVALGTAGALEGFLLAVSNLGPLLPAYFHTFERDTERYIGGLSMVLGTIFTVRIVVMLFDGLMTPYRLWLGCAIAVVTIVGLLLGTYLRRLEVDETKFNWFVVALLVVIALNILRKTVPALFL
ncbi:TSUP family transporter [Halococcus salsus]|uniref:TSUP family transporter n=1 Tax=Halococcus salsus TaxID=2162894 RepID=UPI00135A0D5C|nr:TSUP family transporter [Halococcus salsus]